MLSLYHRKVLRQIIDELEGRMLILEPTAPARSFWDEVTESYVDLEPGETPEVDAGDALETILTKNLEGWDND